MRAKQSTKKASKRAPAKGSAKAAKNNAPKASASAKAGAKVSRKSAPAAPVLRSLPVYEFVAGDLMGYVRLADPDRGFEFSRALQGKSLPAVCKEVLSLRHYLGRGNGGMLIPREAAECEGKASKSGITFQYRKLAKWPVEATARYELLPAGGLDATFAFAFDSEMKGFEAGIETIIPKTYSGICVHAGGRWVTATAGPRLKRFYPRNLGAAELIADGRWSDLRMAGIGLAVEPRGYDYPMLVLWEPGTDRALLYMALTEECSSVWVNGADRTIGMALVGANVKARSAATCRVRALFCKVNQLDDVLPYYRDFVQEARATRKH
ncbi:MAG: hypothetical protein MUQ65_06910 [Armatimonadetes bacterium]|nr:hypothetical protein [Armatimonadota bacterium]